MPFPAVTAIGKVSRRLRLIDCEGTEQVARAVADTEGCPLGVVAVVPDMVPGGRDEVLAFHQAGKGPACFSRAASHVVVVVLVSARPRCGV